MNAQAITAAIFGLIFIITLIVLSIIFPNPTDFQYIIFRIILALAAAGAAAMIPGFMHTEFNPTTGVVIRASGAMAVFAIVFFFNPANLVRSFEGSSPVISDSKRFEILISDSPDMTKIKQFIEEREGIINGIPQYLVGAPLIEDIRGFPINEELVPDFTRFNFQTVLSQVPNFIVFVDFLSPDTNIFEIGLELNKTVEIRLGKITKYIVATKSNYNQYIEAVSKIKGFSIPLSTMQGTFGAGFEGVIVVGRRNGLEGVRNFV